MWRFLCKSSNGFQKLWGMWNRMPQRNDMQERDLCGICTNEKTLNFTDYCTLNGLMVSRIQPGR